MSSKNYEALVVYSLANGEEKAQELQARFQTLVEQNGTAEPTDVWGQKRLAYAIDDEPIGYYVLYRFAAEPEFPAELDRVLGITDGVLRSMITVQVPVSTKSAAKVPVTVIEPTPEPVAQLPAEDATEE
jgi:small subunit ribosomal protein S6